MFEARSTSYAYSQFDMNQFGYETNNSICIYANAQTGLDETKIDNNNISIYPNPSTNGEINIAFAMSMDNIKVNIIDAFGKVVISKNSSVQANQNEKITTDILPKGIYYVNVSNDNYSHTEKIIVQ